MRYFIMFVGIVSLSLISGCSSKKPIGSYQAIECQTICQQGQCTQQCVGASGDYYKK
ncbi:hypothetical protein [uncultured Helicobacter sp.]|uniref:hypothetical protein n=1 Tax=uncultured Helicobacter sp. TaxID=175537 RepID=UPI00374EC16F